MTVVILVERMISKHLKVKKLSNRCFLIVFKGVPPADENGDIGTSDRVGQDESVGTN